MYNVAQHFYTLQCDYPTNLEIICHCVNLSKIMEYIAFPFFTHPPTLFLLITILLVSVSMSLIFCLFVCFILFLDSTYGLVIALLDIYPKKAGTLNWKNICTSMFIAALLTIVKIWKQSRCPSIEKCMKEGERETENGILHRNKKEWNLAISNMDGSRVECIMLSEISQAEKVRFPMELQFWIRTFPRKVIHNLTLFFFSHEKTIYVVQVVYSSCYYIQNYP